MRKRKALVLAIVSLGVFAMGSANAQDEKDEKEPGSGPNPFTDCGIGAALFPNTHWAAVTSNVIWDVGTTAVISATASPETCSGSGAKAAKFINDTYDNVLEDTARGDGEYVSTLLEIYSCPSSAQDQIVAAVRGDVANLLAADDYGALTQLQKAERYFLIVDGKIRTQFSDSCTA